MRRALAEVRAQLRAKGVRGVINKGIALRGRALTRVYYAPQFGRIGPGSSLRRPVVLANTRRISIGARTQIRDGARLEVVHRAGQEPGRIVIGDDVQIEQNVHIVACDEVIIGDRTLITAGVAIVDTTHLAGGPEDGNRSSLIAGGRTGVRIGDRAFIGINAVVLPNVSIGRNAIVGAGSVVTKDVPDNGVVAGSPARLLRILPVAPSPAADR